MKYPTRELVVVVVALLAACGDDDKATADAGTADAAGADAPLAIDASVADAAPPDAAPVCGNGSREDGEECDDGNTMAGDGCEDCQSVGVAPTAFRVTSLSVLDPHLMAEDAGCGKADLTEFVNALIEGSLTDQDGDQLLDFAPVMVFRPLAPAEATSEADFVIADCSATSPVTCRRGAAAPAAMTAQNQASASCMGPLADTTGGYTPAVGTTPAPCFVTAERSLSLSLSGIEIALVDAQIAATYVGAPPTTATGGLLRGFMTEAVADATVIPQLEGITLSALLPGSTSNGCPSDVDVVDGVRGWWFYLAFTAEAVAWTDEAPPASL